MPATRKLQMEYRRDDAINTATQTIGVVQEADTASESCKEDPMKPKDLIVYEENAMPLAKVSMPSGYWLLIDDLSFVRVAGRDVKEVYAEGERIGLESGVLEKAMTAERQARAAGVPTLDDIVDLDLLSQLSNAYD